MRPIIAFASILVLCASPCLCADTGVNAKRTESAVFGLEEVDSRSLQAAWEATGGFLAKKIINTGTQGGSPTLKWNPLLDKLNVSVVVLDALENKVVVRRDGLKNGSILRDGVRALAPGLYKATYNATGESADEYFVIGPPKNIFENLKRKLDNLDMATGKFQPDIEGQLRRGEWLFARQNYNADNKDWQECVVYTLSTLASLINESGDSRQNISKGKPGLHIRGFQSRIDNSKQYYRLFIPATYDPARGVPLLLVMPTFFAAKEKPFIESVYMASHLEAVQLDNFAEKHGFAVLWPGYKNVPDGWTCESTHVGEVIDTVENDYHIDKSRISIYAACGAGYFAGRLVATYPNRFAAVVYDKAIFEREPESLARMPKPMAAWYATIKGYGQK